MCESVKLDQNCLCAFTTTSSIQTQLLLLPIHKNGLIYTFWTRKSTPFLHFHEWYSIREILKPSTHRTCEQFFWKAYIRDTWCLLKEGQSYKERKNLHTNSIVTKNTRARKSKMHRRTKKLFLNFETYVRRSILCCWFEIQDPMTTPYSPVTN